ncbi:unnamed protein product [Amoebophrya sp. A25]|nr:unnamed protein product [Amoebophrya sp. A25]|eukprot:GSA25T00000448001.1
MDPEERRELGQWITTRLGLARHMVTPRDEQELAKANKLEQMVKAETRLTASFTAEMNLIASDQQAMAGLAHQQNHDTGSSLGIVVSEQHYTSNGNIKNGAKGFTSTTTFSSSFAKGSFPESASSFPVPSAISTMLPPPSGKKKKNAALNDDGTKQLGVGDAVRVGKNGVVYTEPDGQRYFISQQWYGCLMPGCNSVSHQIHLALHHMLGDSKSASVALKKNNPAKVKTNPPTAKQVRKAARKAALLAETCPAATGMEQDDPQGDDQGGNAPSHVRFQRVPIPFVKEKACAWFSEAVVQGWNASDNLGRDMIGASCGAARRSGKIGANNRVRLPNEDEVRCLVWDFISEEITKPGFTWAKEVALLRHVLSFQQGKSGKLQASMTKILGDVWLRGDVEPEDLHQVRDQQSIDTNDTRSTSTVGLGLGAHCTAEDVAVPAWVANMYPELEQHHSENDEELLSDFGGDDDLDDHDSFFDCDAQSLGGDAVGGNTKDPPGAASASSSSLVINDAPAQGSEGASKSVSLEEAAREWRQKNMTFRARRYRKDRHGRVHDISKMNAKAMRRKNIPVYPEDKERDQFMQEARRKGMQCLSLSLYRRTETHVRDQCFGLPLNVVLKSGKTWLRYWEENVLSQFAPELL